MNNKKPYKSYISVRTGAISISLFWAILCFTTYYVATRLPRNDIASTYAAMILLVFAAIVFHISILVPYLRTLESRTNYFKTKSATDELTGLFNRSELKIQYEQLHLQDDYIFLLDIDHFKKVNDTYGHNVGDIVLIEVAKFLTSTVRKTDHVFRIGGEEFVVILSSVTEEKALQIGQAMVSNIKHMVQVQAEATTISISITIGMHKPVCGQSLETSLSKADEKLYNGKRNGRDRIVY